MEVVQPFFLLFPTCAYPPPPPSPNYLPPRSMFVVSVRSTIVLNVLTPTIVGRILFVKHILSDILCC